MRRIGISHKGLTMNRFALRVALCMCVLASIVFAQNNQRPDAKVIASSAVQQEGWYPYYDVFGNEIINGQLVSYFNQFSLSEQVFGQNPGSFKAKHPKFNTALGANVVFVMNEGNEFNLSYSLFDWNTTIDFNSMILDTMNIDGMGFEFSVPDIVSVSAVFSWLNFYNHLTLQPYDGPTSVGGLKYDASYQNRMILSRWLYENDVVFIDDVNEFNTMYAIKSSLDILTQNPFVSRVEIFASSTVHQSAEQPMSVFGGTYDHAVYNNLDTIYLRIGNTIAAGKSYEGKAALYEVTYNGSPLTIDAGTYPTLTDGDGSNYIEIPEGGFIDVAVTIPAITNSTFVDEISVKAGNNFVIIRSYTEMDFTYDSFYGIDFDDPEYPIPFNTVHIAKGKSDDFSNVDEYIVPIAGNSGNAIVGAEVDLSILDAELSFGYFLDTDIEHRVGTYDDPYVFRLNHAFYGQASRMFLEDRLNVYAGGQYVDPAYSATFTVPNPQAQNKYSHYYQVNHDPDGNGITKLPMIGEYSYENAALDTDINNNYVVDFIEDFIGFRTVPTFFYNAADEDNNGFPEVYSDVLRPDYQYEPDLWGYYAGFDFSLFDTETAKLDTAFKFLYEQSITLELEKNLMARAEGTLNMIAGPLESEYALSVKYVQDSIPNLRLFELSSAENTLADARLVPVPYNPDFDAADENPTSIPFDVIGDDLEYRDSIALTPYVNYKFQILKGLTLDIIGKAIINQNIGSELNDSTNRLIVTSGVLGRINYEFQVPADPRLTFNTGLLAQRQAKDRVVFVSDGSTVRSSDYDQYDLIALATGRYQFTQTVALNGGYQYRKRESVSKPDNDFDNNDTHTFTLESVSQKSIGGGQVAGVIGFRYKMLAYPDSVTDVATDIRDYNESQLYMYVVYR